jgi:hypothetical protein
MAPFNLPLSETSGPAGSAITVSGSAYAPGELVKVRYLTGLASPRRWRICEATATATGSFSCSGHIPRGANAGESGVHILSVVGLTSHVVITAAFTLT